MLRTTIQAGAVALALASSSVAQVTNGSFETGDFTGWFTQDVGNPLNPLAVVDLGSLGYFGSATSPTDGSYSVLTGFDGNGPGTIAVRQNLTVPKSAPVVLVDYVAKWDLLKVSEDALDRTFGMELWSGGNFVEGFEVLRAPGGTVDTTGDRTTAAVSLAGYAGEALEFGLVWNVPEAFTGPAFFDLDNVRFAGPKLSVLDRASLTVGLDLIKANHDLIKLDLVVKVPDGFSPDGELLAVTVGDVQKEFMLDDSGAAKANDDSVKLLAVTGQPGHRRLKLTCKQGDFAAGFAAHGLLDVDTGKAGTTASLPVHVGLDGVPTDRTLIAVYKAHAGKGGKAVAKAAPELWTTSLSAKLDLALADEDSLKLKTVALVDPGFSPEGMVVRVDIGGWSKEFVLDGDGEAQSSEGTEGVDHLKLVRDRLNPVRQIVTLLGTHGNFQGVHDGFGVIEDTPPGGLELELPMTVTIDGRATRSFVTVTYKAKAGKSGKAST